MDAVRHTFRPELINRIDETIVFSPLSFEQLRAIVDIQIGQLQRRLEERGLRVELTAGAGELLARRGYDPVYGARPLKRAIRQLIDNPLAQALLAGDFQAGDTIRIDCDPTTSVLVFRRQAAAEGAPLAAASE